MRSFLGHASYYKRFIQNFSKIIAPVFALLHKGTEFEWTGYCETSFQLIKQKLATLPIMRGIDWSLPFHIHYDASDYAIGEVLGQEDKDKLNYAIYYISKNLVGAERNYTTIEK